MQQQIDQFQPISLPEPMHPSDILTASVDSGQATQADQPAVALLERHLLSPKLPQ